MLAVTAKKRNETEMILARGKWMVIHTMYGQVWLAECLVVFVAPFKRCMCIAKISICGRIEEGKGITIIIDQN